MSTFNSLVPSHPMAPFLLRAINWAQPDDPEKRYPLMGRMRYVWVDEDYKTIKIMLRDSQKSWSDQSGEVIEQIKRHETLVEFHEDEFDNTHIVATFAPIIDGHYDRELDFKKLMDNLREYDEMCTADTGAPSITRKPFDLFNEALESMKAGSMNERTKNLVKQVGTMIESISAEDEVDKIATEAGIEMKKGPNIKVLAVDPQGNLNDVTTSFMGSSKSSVLIDRCRHVIKKRGLKDFSATDVSKALYEEDLLDPSETVIQVADALREYYGPTSQT